MDKKIESIFAALNKRNIQGIYCKDRGEALAKLLEIVPEDKTIGISGSRTLDEVGIVSQLIKRGNKVFNQYEKGLTPQQSLSVRNQGANADVYLSGANALTKNAEMVFFSANGHRIAGISNAKNVIIVCGINKIVDDIDKGIDRGRNYVTPLNCKRLNWSSACFEDGICHNEICLFPEYKRMCCQILIIEAEISPERLKLILVGEELGY
jgi:hypothetical protein